MRNKKELMEDLKQAMELIKSRKYKQALEIATNIEKELELNPKPDKKVIKALYYILAKAYNATREYTKAERYFSESIKATPKDLDLLFSAGLNALASGSQELAYHYKSMIAKHHGYRNPLYLQLEKTIAQWIRDNQNE